MRFGVANGGHRPGWGSTAESTTKGFKHVRGKGPKGKLIPDDHPHAVRHQTPDVVLTRNHTTWGGPRDMTHDNLDHGTHTKLKKDGGWQHVTRATKKDQQKATHGSVNYDFLRPGENYVEELINVNKKKSHAYTSGAGQHDLITHHEVAAGGGGGGGGGGEVVQKRQMTPHTLKKTLEKLNHERDNKKFIDPRHHGYNILTNHIHPEAINEFHDMEKTMESVIHAKRISKTRPGDTLTGNQGFVPGGPVVLVPKTARPKAILQSEGYAYDILTHRETHGERLERFDIASTKSFRRLANAFDRKRQVRARGQQRAEAVRQRRVNTIARTAHVPRRQQNRGFNIINGHRWTDLPKDDPRRCPKKTGVEPKTVWGKCGKGFFDRNNLTNHPMLGLKHTAGRAKHTRLPTQMTDIDKKNGKTLGRLPDRVTRQQDIVHNDLLGSHF